MSLINPKEIKSKIQWYEKQIGILKQLLGISDLLEGKAPRKKALRKAKGVRRGRKKRGAITDTIKAILGASKKPTASKEIREVLLQKGLVAKDSTTVYTTLNALTRRGVISKSAKGYSMKQTRKKTPGKRRTVKRA